MNETAARARVAVVYESMFGATRLVAETVADQLRPFAELTLTSSSDADVAELEQADLLVVGAPTHVFGLSSETTREDARMIAERSDDGLVFEYSSGAKGLRELLHALPRASKLAHFAAFSTRSAKAPRLFTGSAARRIDRDIRAAGYLPLAPPRDFIVDASHRLVDGQLTEAVEWGVHLAGQLNLLRQRQLGERRSDVSSDQRPL